MILKYLFLVEYEDGSIYKQTAKDTSSKDPLKSEFYDVLQSGKKIVKFTLVNHSLFGLKSKWFKVDLKTGKFTKSSNIKKTDITVEGDVNHPSLLDQELTLIFYRQHQHDFNPTTSQELAHRVTYCLGWQVNIEGTNYKQIMGVK